jgi:hypothetical protein
MAKNFLGHQAMGPALQGQLPCLSAGGWLMHRNWFFGWLVPLSSLELEGGSVLLSEDRTSITMES